MGKGLRLFEPNDGEVCAVRLQGIWEKRTKLRMKMKE